MMSKKQRVAAWAIVGILLVAVFASLAFGVPETQICQTAKDTGKEDCTTHGIAQVGFIQAGRFLDEHNGAVAAVAAIFVACFTGTLWVSTARLWKLGRAEFLSTHRPRLRIRQVEYRDPPIGVARPTEYTLAVAPFIEYVVVNVGDSDATIIEVEAIDWDGPTDASYPAVPQNIQRVSKRHGKVLGSGESTKLRYEVGVSLRTRFCARATEAQRKPMMFLCVVRYIDGLRTTRETSAYRWLCEDHPATRFLRTDYSGADLDYEYED